MQWLVRQSALKYFVIVHKCDSQCGTQGLHFGHAACVFPRTILIVMQGNHYIVNHYIVTASVG